MPDRITSINPATGKEIASYDIYDDKKVENSLKQSQKTFELWRQLPFSKRAIVLKNIAKEIRKEKDRLVKLAVMEMGKPVSQGYYEVEKCASTLDFYAANGAKFLADVVVKTDARKSYVSYQPMGTILA